MRAPGVLSSARPLAFAICSLCALACGESNARTEVMVTVGADSDIRAGIARVEIEVGGGASAMTSVETGRMSFAAPIDWPLSVGLVPANGDTSRLWTVRATAFDASDVVVAWGRVAGGYVAGRTKWAHIQLAGACGGIDCVDHETCCAGLCVVARVDASDLPDFSSGRAPPPNAQVQCMPMDGGIELDSGPPPDTGFADAGVDSGPPDAGPATPTRVGGGGAHSCAVYTPGNVWCWGENTNGEVGDGTAITPRTSARAVTGLADAQDIALGQSHTCALRMDGHVACWGRNNAGQLGDGTTATLSLTPVEVSGVSTAVAIGAGQEQTCVATSDGSALCWGSGDQFQLGTGRLADERVPVRVEMLSDVTAIDGGAGFTCALRADGTIACWGRGAEGQIGDGSAAGTPRLAPVTVMGVTGATSISAGFAHACATLGTGEIMCWGQNNNGQCGDGTMATTGVPVTVHTSAGVLTDVAGVTANGWIWFWSHSCAYTRSGAASCWGSDNQGQLGNGGGGGEMHVAGPVSGVGMSGVRGIAAGVLHACAIIGDDVYCWGGNGAGQIGNGTMTDQTAPVMVMGLPGT